MWNIYTTHLMPLPQTEKPLGLYVMLNMGSHSRVILHYYIIVYQIIKLQTVIFIWEAFCIKLQLNVLADLLFARTHCALKTRKSVSFREAYVCVCSNEGCTVFLLLVLSYEIASRNISIYHSKQEHTFETNLKCSY